MIIQTTKMNKICGSEAAVVRELGHFDGSLRVVEGESEPRRHPRRGGLLWLRVLGLGEVVVAERARLVVASVGRVAVALLARREPVDLSRRFPRRLGRADHGHLLLAVALDRAIARIEGKFGVEVAFDRLEELGRGRGLGRRLRRRRGKTEILLGLGDAADAADVAGVVGSATLRRPLAVL